MSMWLCRAGRYGEFENKFLEDSKVYCTWDNLSESIMQFHTKQDLQQYFVDNNPDVKVKTAMNWASQVWPFAHEMKKSEIVVLPSKIKPVIHFGKITGDYELPDNDNSYNHVRIIVTGLPVTSPARRPGHLIFLWGIYDHLPYQARRSHKSGHQCT